MYTEVQEIERLSPDLLRVMFSGGTLDRFEGSDATDAYIFARFVPEESPITVPFEPSDLDDLPSEHRPRPRRASRSGGFAGEGRLPMSHGSSSLME